MKYSLLLLGALLFASVAISEGGRGRQQRQQNRQPVRCEDGSRPTRRCSDGSPKQRGSPCSDGAQPVKTCEDGSDPVAVIMPGRCSDNSRPSCPDSLRPKRRCADGQQKQRGRGRGCSDGSQPKKRCTDGSDPVCADGSTPAARQFQPVGA